MKASAVLGMGRVPLPESVIVRVACCVLLVVFLSLPSASLAHPAPQWIDVEGAAGAKLRAALFRPSGDGPFPIVLLLHRASGLSDDYLAWGPELSRAGSLVVAGCFARGGSVQGVNPCPDAPLLVQAFAVRNVAATIEAAARLPGVQRYRVGLVGWSWGGAAAVVVASSGVGVQAVVSISGGPYGTRVSNNDPSALANVDRLSASVLILHSTTDDMVPVGSPRALEARAREHGKSVEGPLLRRGRSRLLAGSAIQGGSDQSHRGVPAATRRTLRPSRLMSTPRR